MWVLHFNFLILNFPTPRVYFFRTRNLIYRPISDLLWYLCSVLFWFNQLDRLDITHSPFYHCHWLRWNISERKSHVCISPRHLMNGINTWLYQDLKLQNGISHTYQITTITSYKLSQHQAAWVPQSCAHSSYNPIYS